MLAKVVVLGALGRMGRSAVRWIEEDPELTLVGGIDKTGGQLKNVLLSDNAETLFCSTRPDVLVDFSTPSATLSVAPLALRYNINLVIGTTGIPEDKLADLGRKAEGAGSGMVVAPNFSLGAVVMMWLASKAARFFDSVEIVEMHHQNKLDFPSGTAIRTAHMMASSRGESFSPSTSSSRGENIEGILIHSLRLPGILSSQEVILGGKGETLTISHRTVDRECYREGLLTATKKVSQFSGLVTLERILGLDGA
jgi:4-hydroxy-tetrahydrodipicolinate reductase